MRGFGIFMNLIKNVCYNMIFPTKTSRKNKKMGFEFNFTINKPTISNV